jgi:hypothetical protein
LHVLKGDLKEAVDNYKNAVLVVEKELKKLFQEHDLRVFYEVRPFEGWATIENYPSLL